MLKRHVPLRRQAHDYIIAGACMAVGFRFAGSANSDAFDCLVRETTLHYHFSKMLSCFLVLLVVLIYIYIYFPLTVQVCSELHEVSH